MTDIEIVNLAVTDCGCNPIASLTDGSNEARICAAKYTAVRDAVLESREWTFAKWRFVPSKDPVAPAWGYANQFIIPSNVLIIPRIYTDTVGTLVDDWVREGFRILTDESIIYAEAIVRVGEGDISPGCVRVIAALLASEIAIPLTENRQLAADMDNKYQRLIVDAGASDGKQGRTQRLRPPAMPGRRRIS
jgi:hypothetical protein